VVGAPLAGEMLVMMGAETVKFTVVLLEIPAAVTFTGPVDTEFGTVAVIWLSDQVPIEAAVPLNATDPVEDPNQLPLICTVVPGSPAVGLMPATTTDPTVKGMALLLLLPPTVTFTGPVVAVAGTLATICVSFQLEIVCAATLLKERVPCVEPKPVPVTVTEVVFAGPPSGEKVFTDRFATV